MTDEVTVTCRLCSLCSAFCSSTSSACTKAVCQQHFSTLFEPFSLCCCVPIHPLLEDDPKFWHLSQRVLRMS